MIKKIKTIGNFAAFKSYEWDSNICDDDGNGLNLKKLNILYGRNYSGKTTLSRIVRTLETGSIDARIDQPAFQIQLDDDSIVDHRNPAAHEQTVRVFNEDFVKENLRFIIDPEQDANAFAIFGKDNNALEKEIGILNGELGSEEPNNETGLYLDLTRSKSDSKKAGDAATNAIKELDKLLSNKATGGSESIKYQAGLYGDQNYNITSLRQDIRSVTATDFEPIDSKEEADLRALVKERRRNDISPQQCPKLDLPTLISEVESLVAKNISRSNKIDALLQDATLNRWASEGQKLHSRDHRRCKFCDNSISETRWAALESHFDDESGKLECDIETLAARVKQSSDAVDRRDRFNKSIFYSQFQDSVADIEKRAGDAIRSCRTTLDKLSGALARRKKNILNPFSLPELADSSSDLTSCYDEYASACKDANDLSKSLSLEQSKARKQLRLRTVKDFIDTIDYTAKSEKISRLNTANESAESQLSDLQALIDAKRTLIETKTRQLNDEEEGAKRVNELLAGYFGNDYLTLRTNESETEGQGKQVRFEIVRGNKKAYHLSEGERSLLAFCYFMAKLEVADTIDAKPIIWIDDPISSLDGNHVFFVYSLINEHLFRTIDCKQVFISTHSLEFFKYTRRLPGANRDWEKKESKKKCRFLLVERTNESSTVKLLPRHMVLFVTEFNYLFQQIYKCASISEDDEANYESYYSFGNNARKFLEIYLYYAYPDEEKNEDKMTRFFGDDRAPAILVDRVSNEYSHLAGSVERGATPVLQPEMKSCAKLILSRLKRNRAQYSALLRSIGENDEAAAFDNEEARASPQLA